jgi:hypothetical protein
MFIENLCAHLAIVIPGAGHIAPQRNTQNSVFTVALVCKIVTEFYDLEMTFHISSKKYPDICKTKFFL